MTDLPPNVYRVAQRRFDAIPGSPWVYWIAPSIRRTFEFLPKLGEFAPSIHGTATYDNFRFLRFWWEVGISRTGRDYASWEEFEVGQKPYVPYMKGGTFRRWYGNQEYVLQLINRGRALIEFLNLKRDSIRGTDNIFHEGITYSFLTSSTFSARISPGGFIFDVAGSSLFPDDLSLVLSVMNSKFAAYVLKLINPTVNFQVGDLARLPVPIVSSDSLRSRTRQAIMLAKATDAQDETTYDFIAPPRWDTGLDDPSTGSGQVAAAQARLAALEAQIDDEVFNLYGISAADRAAIEAELNGLTIDDLRFTNDKDSAEAEIVNPKSEIENRQELAVRWISYAVGIVLGRFRVGDEGPKTKDKAPLSSVLRPSSIGCAVYRRQDFAVGSLPAPAEAEFDQLVGPPERFAYIDESGGRHLFSAEVEAALRELALPDGIAVLDEGHPRDLPALVEKTLHLVLDGNEREATETQRTQSESENRLTLCSPCLRGKSHVDEVIRLGAGGNLRRFLERDYFTQWHLKWYRKRPVYWPLQSARRSYGFVLFHERVEAHTFYTLQRDYVDHKLNGLRLEIGDLQAQVEGLSGAARKRVERQIEQATQLLNELTGFAQTIERIVREGYEPAPDWIDDGVILRLAPLWELIPLWPSEPKTYWARLQKGDYDWSRIAMRYWPERVREKCETNKSFAIAHGHEEWYEGD